MEDEDGEDEEERENEDKQEDEDMSTFQGDVFTLNEERRLVR